tara:strand:+ start:820 stop:978 length:159 start_codon:yes stop_codon:yes gene_type:complete
MTTFTIEDRLNAEKLLEEKNAIIKKQADRIKKLELKYKQEFDYVEYLLAKCI